MKTISFMGLVALLLPLAFSPANALTFNYTVDYTVNTAFVTGSIQTTCDACTLTTSDVTAWTFNVEVGAMLSFSISGFAPTYAYGDLEITPTAIIFNSNGTTNRITEFRTDNDCVGFDEVQCDAPAAYYYDAENSSSGVQSHNTLAGPLTIATATPVTATPLPAALPLFATSLGVVGLLGWRRKRKHAASIAAA